MAQYTQYRQFLEKYISLNTVEWMTLRSKLQIKRFRQGEIILHSGDTCRRMVYLNHGLARAYYIDEKGRDHTWSIFFNDTQAKLYNLLMIDGKSFSEQSPAILSIEILEDSEAVIMEYDAVQFLYRHYRKSADFGRMIAEEAYATLHHHIIMRQSLSSRERFVLFMEQTPHLLEKVPQYHIATWLGMTPQHLSRLRSQM